MGTDVTEAAATVIVLLAAALVAQGALAAWRTRQREDRDASERDRLLDKVIVLQAATPAVAQQAVAGTAAAVVPPPIATAPPTPAIHNLGPRRIEPSTLDDEDTILRAAEEITTRRIAKAVGE